MPTLFRADHVFTLDLGDDENRFSLDWLAKANGLLDEVLADPGAGVLVTRGQGKFYSNGLDLAWLMANGDKMGAYVERVHALFARVLAFPMPTVAAVTGHAFGAGAMLAMAHDYRVMRTDRGFFCFPEVDIHIPFTPGMAALIQAKLTPAAAVRSMTTGQRFGGEPAQAIGLVDATAPDIESTVSAACDLVAGLAGKDRTTMRAIKSTMYGPALAALANADAIGGSGLTGSAGGAGA
ncbi:MAG: enoyl-CoA hydratase-related protein [Candidatus Nanopelagicales bacterium]